MSTNITTTLKGRHHTASLSLRRDDLKPKRYSHELLHEIRSHFYERALPHYHMIPARNHMNYVQHVAQRLEQLIKGVKGK